MADIGKLTKMRIPELLFRLRRGAVEYQHRFRASKRAAGEVRPISEILDLGDGSWLPSGLGRRPRDEAILGAWLAQRQEKGRYFVGGKDDAELRTLLKTSRPELYQNAIREAEPVCRHRFDFLGISKEYDGDIDWTADPVSGEPWPPNFYADLRMYGNAGPGDVKHVWELNRHQHFIVLGKAYWLTGDERFAQEFVSQFLSWERANPYLAGVNWGSSLEAALRVMSWLWAFHFCMKSPAMTDEFLHRFLSSVVDHGDYVSSRLSFYVSPYNHLIGEACALFLLGSAFPELRQARGWSSLGWRILEDEVGKQFHSDGVSAEQASSYHYFTLGFFLLGYILMHRLSGEYSPVLKPWLIRALEFGLYLTRPDGKTPMIGDNDSARSIWFGPCDPWDFREFLALGAALFSRADFKHMQPEFPEMGFWLLGPAGHGAYQRVISSLPEETSKAFLDSGYYIMRSGWKRHDAYLCLDFGNQSAGLHEDNTPSVAHGHPDLFSFEVTANGKNLIIDAGMFTYNGKPEWHDYFRSTQAHNTLVVDGKDQCKLLHRLNYCAIARPQNIRVITTPDIDYFSGEHDGFSESDDRIVHRRTVVFRKPSYWILVDEVLGEGRHQVEKNFHFAPKVDVVVSEEENGIRVSDGAERAFMRILPSDRIHVSVEKGAVSPVSGWMAPGYGLKTPAARLRCQAEVELPFRSYTVIEPLNAPHAPAAVVLRRDAAAVAQIMIEAAEGRETFIYNPGNRQMSFRSVRSDARIWLLAESPGDGAELSLIDSSRRGWEIIPLPGGHASERSTVAEMQT